jgi:hypothetical protein
MSLQTSPTLFFVSALACAIPAGALAAETPPPPKPAASADTGSKDKPPLIIQNPDGTLTVQKAPASEKTDAAQRGLVIPPQLVVPTVRAPANEKGN